MGFQVTVGGVTLGEVFSGRDINYFSNPNITFRGQSLGVADSRSNAADNAAAMNQYAPTAAARTEHSSCGDRGSTCRTGPYHQHVGPEHDQVQGDLLRWRGRRCHHTGQQQYQRDRPSNFSGSATFLGIDTQQNTGPAPVTASSWNSPVVIADYSIAVPSVGDLSTYSFTLGSSPVRTSAGWRPAGRCWTPAATRESPAARRSRRLLPQYAGGDVATNTPLTSRPIGLAAELGNISGQSIVLNDNGSGYFANTGRAPPFIISRWPIRAW